MEYRESSPTDSVIHRTRDESKNLNHSIEEENSSASSHQEEQPYESVFKDVLHDIQKGKWFLKTPQRNPLSEHYIGIDQIPKQRQDIISRQGIQFNMMVVGQAGLGKQTFVNTLYGKPITSLSKNNIREDLVEINCQFSNSSIGSDDNKEEGSAGSGESTGPKELWRPFLKQNIVLTPNYGSKCNNMFAWLPLVNYIEENMRSYMFQEEQPERTRLKDNRVHVALYFLNPTMKGLDVLDVITMKELSHRVNLIPVIAKSDIMTRDELNAFKTEVQQILVAQDISVCKFLHEDQRFKENIEQYLTHIPFGIVSSCSSHYRTEHEADKVAGRKYKTGVAEVNNASHSDMGLLRQLLIDEMMMDFIDSTETYYESCREMLLDLRLSGVPDSFEDLPKYEQNSKDPRQLKEVAEGGDLLSIYRGIEGFNKAKMDELFANWDSEFLWKQLEIKGRFQNLLQVEECKFQEWSQTLLRRQELYARELNDIYNSISVLTGDCQELECALQQQLQGHRNAFPTLPSGSSGSVTAPYSENGTTLVSLLSRR